MVINIIEPPDSDYRPEHYTEVDDVKVITIPYLYNKDNQINTDAIRILNEVMRG